VKSNEKQMKKERLSCVIFNLLPYQQRQRLPHTQVFLATIGDRDEEKLVNDLGIRPAHLEQVRDKHTHPHTNTHTHTHTHNTHTHNTHTQHAQLRARRYTCTHVCSYTRSCHESSILAGIASFTGILALSEWLQYWAATQVNMAHFLLNQELRVAAAEQPRSTALSSQNHKAVAKRQKRRQKQKMQHHVLEEQQQDADKLTQEQPSNVAREVVSLASLVGE